MPYLARRVRPGSGCAAIGAAGAGKGSFSSCPDGADAAFLSRLLVPPRYSNIQEFRARWPGTGFCSPVLSLFSAPLCSRAGCETGLRAGGRLPSLASLAPQPPGLSLSRSSRPPHPEPRQPPPPGRGWPVRPDRPSRAPCWTSLDALRYLEPRRRLSKPTLRLIRRTLSFISRALENYPLSRKKKASPSCYLRGSETFSRNIVGGTVVAACQGI